MEAKRAKIGRNAEGERHGINGGHRHHDATFGTSSAGCDERATRAETRHADVQALMQRYRGIAGQCELNVSTEGEFGYAELTYGPQCGASRTVKYGWRLGEEENESLAYTWLALELLTACGDLAAPSL